MQERKHTVGPRGNELGQEEREKRLREETKEKEEEDGES